MNQRGEVVTWILLGLIGLSYAAQYALRDDESYVVEHLCKPKQNGEYLCEERRRYDFDEHGERK